MKIIVRCCGERTEKRCIELAKKQGEVFIVKNTYPFGEAIRRTYEMAMKFNDKWVCVVDADVLLFNQTLIRAVDELNGLSDNMFCLDGKTNDKILMSNRRAGIHIYRIDFLKKAIGFIDNNNIKPESNVRRKMEKLGYPTYVSKIIFGKHDFEQYYCDLWRKAICQTRKLARKIKNRPLKWHKLSKKDKDFLVIYNAHRYGKKISHKIIIDKRCDFEAEKQIRRMGLSEKGPLK